MRSRVVFGLPMVAMCCATALGVPLGTGFTYQGELTDAGLPANGIYDLSFTLWTAAVGGSQVGNPSHALNTQVTDGLFTVQINTANEFGPSAFMGDARWLQVSVEGTPLSPRQPVTPAPFALFALDGPGSPGFWAANGNHIYNTNTGNVGIGLNAPTSARLSVQSNSGAHAVQGVATSTGRAGYFECTNAASTATTVRIDTNSTNSGVAAIAGVNSGNGRAAIFELTNAANGQPAILATHAGTGPGLRVQKGADYLDLSVNAINTEGDGFFGDPLYLNNTSTSTVLIGMGGGNCGVGGGSSSLPLVSLHVDGGSDAALTNIASGYFLIGDAGGGNIVMDNNEIMARSDGAAAHLWLNHEGGDVRIGQGSGGTSRLVTPVLQITGGADLSENFDVSGAASAEPGMVVCIDPHNPGRLTTSLRAYDRTVAGVISGAGGVKPGMLMGHSGTVADGAHPVALTGRVYVLCDATASAITPGDLLTTADVPGHAMKAVDAARAQGATLGKAMSTLSAGERGLVLVLVNLQ